MQRSEIILPQIELKFFISLRVRPRNLEYPYEQHAVIISLNSVEP